MPQDEILPNSEADEPQRPKPKKVKVKVWDEIVMVQLGKLRSVNSDLRPNQK